MTVPEVLAAFPGEATELPSAVAYGGGRRGLVDIATYEIGHSSYSVHFLFDAAGSLVLINIVPSGRANVSSFQALSALLIEKYGQPLTNQEEKTRGSDKRSQTWRTAGALIDLSFFYPGLGDPICVLQYRPPVREGLDKL